MIKTGMTFLEFIDKRKKKFVKPSVVTTQSVPGARAEK